MPASCSPLSAPRSLVPLALVVPLVLLSSLPVTAEDGRRAALADADRAYNAAAEARDRDALGRLLGDDAVFFAESIHRGRDAYLEAWGPLWSGKLAFSYRGTPLEAVVDASGTIGYTLGEVETRFQRPGLPAPNVTQGHYLHVWTWDATDGDKPGWRLRAGSALVVHPTLGAARDPRSGLMTAWPELADQIGASITIDWTPERVERAPSGELAYSLGKYSARFVDGDSTLAGSGHFLAVWTRDAEERWQLAAEGFTPPGIHGSDDADGGS